jgi:hypothetical protein
MVSPGPEEERLRLDARRYFPAKHFPIHLKNIGCRRVARRSHGADIKH